MLSFNCHSTQHLGPACPSAFIQLSFNLTFKASKFPASGILTHVCSKKSESEFWTWLLSGWYLLTLTGKGKRNGHTKWMSQQPQKLSHCLWDLIYILPPSLWFLQLVPTTPHPMTVWEQGDDWFIQLPFLARTPRGDDSPSLTMDEAYMLRLILCPLLISRREIREKRKEKFPGTHVYSLKPFFSSYTVESPVVLLEKALMSKSRSQKFWLSECAVRPKHSVCVCVCVRFPDDSDVQPGMRIGLALRLSSSPFLSVSLWAICTESKTAQ